MNLAARLTGPWRAVPILGLTQIIAWGSSFYAISVLKTHVAADTAWSAVLVVAGISVAMGTAGLCAPLVGRLINDRGGRMVMATGSVLMGIALALLPLANHPAIWIGVWVLIGVAQSMALYDAAFATLAEIFRARARTAITALTLFGGFASTVFWPLTYSFNELFGWRETYFIYGAMNLLICAPLHAFTLPQPAAEAAAKDGEGPAATVPVKLLQPSGLSFLLLAGAFSINAFFMSAFAIHLVGLLEHIGLAAAAAVAVGALVGPSQVGGRLAEFVLARKRHPIEVAVFTMLLMPAAFLLLAFGGAKVAAAFAIGYGVSQGLLTIVRGTVPLALFGPSGFAIVLGRLAAPVLVAQSVAPVAFGFALERFGTQAVLIGSACVGALSLAAIGFLAWRIRRSARG
ncbi:MAG: MFS transporter [Bradyrhizobiaceae bacterium]|nr:MFS transporter [Bradyrhizobiaceae bacterium]